MIAAVRGRPGSRSAPSAPSPEAWRLAKVPPTRSVRSSAPPTRSRPAVLHALDRPSSMVDLIDQLLRAVLVLATASATSPRRRSIFSTWSIRIVCASRTDAISLALERAVLQARSIRPWKAKHSPSPPTSAATPAPQPPPLRHRSAPRSATDRDRLRRAARGVPSHGPACPESPTSIRRGVRPSRMINAAAQARLAAVCYRC